MGQRHQIIVIYPEMNLGTGNPNNQPARAEVIHHQWLYGRSALFALNRVLRLAVNCWDGEGTDYLFGRDANGYTSGDGTQAIAAAVSVDPDTGYYHRTHVWEAAEWNGMTGKYGPGQADPAKLEPEMFDNNDGITVIQFVVGEIKPRYAFITPGHLEGSHWKELRDGKGPWSAAEYLGFYYNAKEQGEWPAEVKQELALVLGSIESAATLMTAEEVQTLLPKLVKKKRARKAKAGEVA